MVVLLVGWIFNGNWRGPSTESQKLSSLVPDARPICVKDGSEVLSYSIEVTAKNTPELKSLSMSTLNLDPVNFEGGNIISISGSYIDFHGADYTSYASYPDSDGANSRTSFEIEMNGDGSIKRFRMADVESGIESAAWQSAIESGDKYTIYNMQSMIELALKMKERCD